MAYTFSNSPFQWGVSNGNAPTAEEIALGLQGGMALPAAFVNQQWTATYKCLNEIMTLIQSGNIYTVADNIATNADNSNAISGTLNAVFGTGNTASGLNTVVGKRSKTPTAASGSTNTGDLFVIGNGLVGGAKSNAFRVTAAGEVMGTQAYAASGADFAECFEWADGNPNGDDRRGLFVTLDGEKIRLATADDDYILGAVSATPTVIGDAHTDDWHGKYETDIFGARVLENGAYKLAEGFDEEQDTNYTSRLKRAEWAAVGLLGKLVVVDDGTCEVNGYCYPSMNGIATVADKGYRVMARIDETHVKILLK